MPLFILPKSAVLILGQGESLPLMSPRKHPANVDQNYQFPCWQDHALLFVWNFRFSVQPWAFHNLKHFPTRFYSNSGSSGIYVIANQGNNSGRAVALPKHLYLRSGEHQGRSPANLRDPLLSVCWKRRGPAGSSAKAASSHNSLLISGCIYQPQQLTGWQQKLPQVILMQWFRNSSSQQDEAVYQGWLPPCPLQCLHQWAGEKIFRFKDLLNCLQVLLQPNLDLGNFNCFFHARPKMPGAGWAPPAPLDVWSQRPPTLLLCWAGEKVKASFLTADMHMNVRHLPNKYLPKGGLISIPRFSLCTPSICSSSAAPSLRDAGFLLRPSWCCWPLFHCTDPQGWRFTNLLLRSQHWQQLPCCVSVWQ